MLQQPLCILLVCVLQLACGQDYDPHVIDGYGPTGPGDGGADAEATGPETEPETETQPNVDESGESTASADPPPSPAPIVSPPTSLGTLIILRNPTGVMNLSTGNINPTGGEYLSLCGHETCGTSARGVVTLRDEDGESKADEKWKVEGNFQDGHEVRLKSFNGDAYLAVCGKDETTEGEHESYGVYAFELSGARYATPDDVPRWVVEKVDEEDFRLKLPNPAEGVDWCYLGRSGQTSCEEHASYLRGTTVTCYPSHVDGQLVTASDSWNWKVTSTIVTTADEDVTSLEQVLISERGGIAAASPKDGKNVEPKKAESKRYMRDARFHAQGTARHSRTLF